MSLVAQAAAASGLAPDAAEQALGSIIAALKLSAPPAVLQPIEALVPELAPLAARSLPAFGGRTGELLSAIADLTSDKGARQLERQLEGAGISAPARAAVVQALLAQLRARAGDAPVDALLAAAPMLSRLGAAAA